MVIPEDKKRTTNEKSAKSAKQRKESAVRQNGIMSKLSNGKSSKPTTKPKIIKPKEDVKIVKKLVIANDANYRFKVSGTTKVASPKSSSSQVGACLTFSTKQLPPILAKPAIGNSGTSSPTPESIKQPAEDQPKVAAVDAPMQDPTQYQKQEVEKNRSENDARTQIDQQSNTPQGTNKVVAEIAHKESHSDMGKDVERAKAVDGDQKKKTTEEKKKIYPTRQHTKRKSTSSTDKSSEKSHTKKSSKSSSSTIRKKKPPLPPPPLPPDTDDELPPLPPLPPDTPRSRRNSNAPKPNGTPKSVTETKAKRNSARMSPGIIPRIKRVEPPIKRTSTSASLDGTVKSGTPAAPTLVRSSSSSSLLLHSTTRNTKYGTVASRRSLPPTSGQPTLTARSLVSPRNTLTRSRTSADILSSLKQTSTAARGSVRASGSLSTAPGRQTPTTAAARSPVGTLKVKAKAVRKVIVVRTPRIEEKAAVSNAPEDKAAVSTTGTETPAPSLPATPPSSKSTPRTSLSPERPATPAEKKLKRKPVDKVQLQKEVEATAKRLVELGFGDLVPPQYTQNLSHQSGKKEELEQKDTSTPSRKEDDKDIETIILSDTAVAPDPEKPSPESLRKFLKEETQALVFWTYMKRMYNHELFSFWFAIDEYRDLPEDNLQLAANWIFEKYFRQGSEFELSIAADFRKAIEQEMTSGPTKHTFDAAQDVVWNLMVFEHFPKFLSSEIYRHWKETGKGLTAGWIAELRRSDTYRQLKLFIQKVDSTSDPHAAFTRSRRQSNLLVNQGYGVAFGVKRGPCEPPCECDCYIPQTKGGICVCGHWPAKHKNLGKVPTKISDIISDKEKIKQKLMEPAFKLISALCDHSNSETAEDLTRSLIHIFDFHERSYDLLKFAVSREVRSTNDPKQIFREDRFTFRMISNFMQWSGTEWLRTVFQPLVNEITRLNPSKVSTPKERKQSIRRLKKTVEGFLDAIFRSVRLMPSKLRLVFVLVQIELHTTLPDCEVNGLAALLFLRMICPALCAPHRFGICTVSPTPAASRGLILVAKILQNLSVNMKFGHKDYKEIDDFIVAHYPQMQKFLASLGNLGTKSPSALPDPKASKLEKDLALETLITQLKQSPKILELSF